MLTSLYVYLALGPIIGLGVALYGLVLDIGTYFHNRKFPLSERSYHWVDEWWQYVIIIVLVSVPVINIGTLILFLGMVWKPMNFIIKYLKTH